MKSHKIAIQRLLAMSCFALVCVSASAQINITGSLTAPTPGASDQYFLGTAGSDSNNVEGQLDMGASPYTANNDASTYIASGRNAQGQTFTTGSNSQGYNMNSITIQQVDYTTNFNNGTWWSIPSGTIFQLAVGTVNGTTLVQKFSGSATWTGGSMSGGNNAAPYASGTGTYFTFDLSGSGITLGPNSSYYFEIAPPSSGEYFEMDGVMGGSYAGGTGFTGGTANSVDTAFNAVNGQRTFDVGLSAVPVPEPTTMALIGMGLTGILIRRRRRVSNSQ